MRTPAITVVLIVHNTAPWLKECLDSIASQSFRDFEIVVVDVASNRETKRVFRRERLKLRRVRLLKLATNVGGATAGNLGIQEARGRYVFLMDSDDVLPPDALRDLHRAAVDGSYDVAIGRALSLREGRLAPMRYSPDVLTWAKPLEVRSLHERPELTVAPYYWGRLYRRDLLLEHRIEMRPGRVFADRYFSCMALKYSRRTGVIPELTYYWRRDHDADGTVSITQRSAVLETVKERLASFADVESLFAGPEDAELLAYVRLTNLMRLFIHAKHAPGDEGYLEAFAEAALPYARTFRLDEVAGCEFLLAHHKVQWYLLVQERWDDLATFIERRKSAPDPEVRGDRIRYDYSAIVPDLPEAVRSEHLHRLGPVSASLAVGPESMLVEAAVDLPSGFVPELIAVVERRHRVERERRYPPTGTRLEGSTLRFEATLPPPSAEKLPRLALEYTAHGRFGAAKIVVPLPADSDQGADGASSAS